MSRFMTEVEMIEETGFCPEDFVVDAKVKYEDEMRRLAVMPCTPLSYLRSKIFKLFKLNGRDAEQLEIRFIDVDGDKMTMSTDDDVDYAVFKGARPLRLQVSWREEMQLSKEIRLVEETTPMTARLKQETTRMTAHLKEILLVEETTAMTARLKA